jgi:hypothetical protein
MRYEEQGREGTEAHSEARRRLDEALGHERDMQEDLDASKGTAGELPAATRLASASDKKAAREAWMAWVERGY